MQVQYYYIHNIIIEKIQMTFLIIVCDTLL